MSDDQTGRSLHPLGTVEMMESLSRRSLMRSGLGFAGIVSGISVAGCLGLPGSDHARYYNVSDISVEDFDYDATKQAAEAADYTVDGPYYGTLKEPTGIHPDGLSDLDARFGDDYRVDHVVRHYTPSTRVVAGFRPDGPTELYLRDERAWTSADPFRPEYMPPANWLREWLTLLFAIDTTRADEYVQELVDVITAEETDLPSIEVAEEVTFDAVYQFLTREHTSTTATHSQGAGWHVVTYTRDDTQLADVAYRLQSTKVSQERGQATYVVQFDPLGGVGLEITLPAGETIPESERRDVFREQFSAIGIPPDLVNDVEFEYVASMW